MCGRYTLTNVAPNLIGPLFGVDEFPAFSPRYNVSPTQDAPVVRVVEPGAKRSLSLLRWGLVPAWAKDVAIGSRMINARGDTAPEKPAYRSSFKSKRCLVVTDGFYEWKKLPGGKKQPCWIHRKDSQPFAFAGLWARWKSPEGEPLDTFTIITTEAHPNVIEVHDRMPVIIPPASYGAWLDPEEKRMDLLQSMINHAGGEDLVLTPVSPRVNNPRNEGPENLRPLGEQQSLL
ncbi:SOS response-associated peptidase [Polyangium aurulentum]|uniref:SOS response-associated peptidase n=1 Tax=Polyangium aurulentum TaxID=2567896 RepID=UPI00146D87B1|nr:SOS response-associated peptidase [Polyangium aurulentum]UQA59448.1 SOS response-associated peptidase [Polyangium aurulentum]